MTTALGVVAFTFLGKREAIESDKTKATENCSLAKGIVPHFGNILIVFSTNTS